METTNPKISHTYQNYGWFDIALKVIDNNDEESVSTPQKIRVHAPGIADPGEDGETTLEGIDFDGDGVRDDVQRWIDEYYGEKLNQKNALIQLAKTTQQLILFNGDYESAKSLFVQQQLDQRCLSSLLDEGESVTTVIHRLQYVMHNTLDRLNVYLDLDENVSFEEVVTPNQEIEDYANNCNFEITE